MKSFQARTRLRGEVTYYQANWEVIEQQDPILRRVMFLEGPHMGDVYLESMCVIAKDEKYLLGE